MQLIWFNIYFYINFYQLMIFCNWSIYIIILRYRFIANMEVKVLISSTQTSWILDPNDSNFYLCNSILLYMLYLTSREDCSLDSYKVKNNEEILCSSPGHSEVMYNICFVLLYAFYIVTSNSVILWDFLSN